MRIILVFEKHNLPLKSLNYSFWLHYEPALIGQHFYATTETINRDKFLAVYKLEMWLTMNV